MSAGVPRALAVLLVEDSPADGRLLIEALKPAIASGAIVIQTVKTLSQAMAALQGFDFSCVLLDLGLPDGRGIDSVRALREVERKAAIIVLTGLDDEKLAAEALSQGAQDYLVKGASDGEQLLRQLRRAVQRHQKTYNLEQRHDQAFFEASHDALTLLPNAALFTDRARQRLIALRQQVLPASAPKLSLVYLEIKGLDEVRERYGSLRADELLRSVSEQWSESLAPQDTLARMGDNSFALLRPEMDQPTDYQALLQIFQRHLNAASSNAMVDKALLLAAGVVTTQDTLQSMEELLASAQRMAVQSDSPQAASIKLEPSEASPRMETDVQWQPWVDVSSRRCIGLELISAAQQSEGSAANTLAAATALTQQARLWSHSGFKPTLLALDIPATALDEEGFVASLIRQLTVTDLAPERVQLEISETVFARQSQHLAALTQLRKQGFRLVLKADGGLDIPFHDFASAPVDGYKLGPALVRQLTDEMLHGAARRVVNAILGAAQHLGATVTASGVDSEASIATLRVIGLRWMQGRVLLPAQDTENVPTAWDRPIALRV